MYIDWTFHKEDPLVVGWKYILGSIEANDYVRNSSEDVRALELRLSVKCSCYDVSFQVNKSESSCKAWVNQIVFFIPMGVWGMCQLRCEESVTSI